MHINNTNLPKKILTWYDNNKRILPWRISQKFKRNQYYRILSEFMLQQTQVKTVIPYFKNFVKKIPTLKILSTKNNTRVLKLWEGLGYYRRARNLHATAKILIKKHDGKLPEKLEEIKKLPGVGDYTARALLALVYNQPHIPFDGNIKRVFSRLFNTSIEKNKNKIKLIIEEQFYTNRNGDLAEALMEFGAIICKPNDPQCNICNLKNNCYFFKKKSSVLFNKKRQEKEKKYNIYCYLKKQKKEIALTKNKSFTFLSNFYIPETKLVTSNNKKKSSGWIYLCNYKNNISNIKMDINLFYKFIKSKPKKFTWYFIDKPNSEFIPSFTKKIFKKISRVYN
jgi:A/G-specific adenine glycosylase